MKKQDVASPLRQTINGATYSVPAILRMIDAAARDAYRGSDRAMIELVAQLIRDQQAEIESLRAAVTIVEENEQLRSRLAEAERDVTRLMHLASIGGENAPNDNGEYCRLVATIRAAFGTADSGQRTAQTRCNHDVLPEGRFLWLVPINCALSCRPVQVRRSDADDMDEWNVHPRKEALPNVPRNRGR